MPEGLAQGTVPAGDYAAFEGSDTGVGMDEQTRQRAVEPLFTTRTDQAGVGLGLATAHAFATQTGGALDIGSTPDVGTTVILLLPTSSADGSAPAP